MTRRRCVPGRARRAKSFFTAGLCLRSSGMTEDGRGMSVVPARIRACLVQPMATSKATQDGAKSCSDGSFLVLSLPGRVLVTVAIIMHSRPPPRTQCAFTHLLSSSPLYPPRNVDFSPHPLAQRHPGLAQRGEDPPQARITDAIGA